MGGSTQPESLEVKDPKPGSAKQRTEMTTFDHSEAQKNDQKWIKG